MKKKSNKDSNFESVGWSKDFGAIDNGTTEVFIPTPKGWKCKRKNCNFNVKHTHTTYSALFKENAS